MSEEELLKILIRSSAMETAVAWYCCQQGHDGPGKDSSPVMPLLKQLRNMFMDAAKEQGDASL